MELLFTYTEGQRILLQLISQRVSVKAGAIGAVVFGFVLILTVLWLSYRGKVNVLKTLTAKYNDLKKKCSEYQRMVSSLKHAGQQKDKKIKEQQITIGLFKKDIQEMSATIDECQEKMNTINSEFSRVSKENKQLREGIAGLRQEIKSYQKEKGKMQSKI